MWPLLLPDRNGRKESVLGMLVFTITNLQADLAPDTVGRSAKPSEELSYVYRSRHLSGSVYVVPSQRLMMQMMNTFAETTDAETSQTVAGPKISQNVNYTQKETMEARRREEPECRGWWGLQCKSVHFFNDFKTEIALPSVVFHSF